MDATTFADTTSGPLSGSASRVVNRGAVSGPMRRREAVNRGETGTKAAFHHLLSIPAGGQMRIQSPGQVLVGMFPIEVKCHHLP